jgi:hypothetical protein
MPMLHMAGLRIRWTRHFRGDLIQAAHLPTSQKLATPSTQSTRRYRRWNLVLVIVVGSRIAPLSMAQLFPANQASVEEFVHELSTLTTSPPVVDPPLEMLRLIWMTPDHPRISQMH